MARSAAVELGLDPVSSLQNEMRPGSQLENREAVPLCDRTHSELDHERVRIVQAIRREADVADPYGGSEIRVGHSGLSAA